MSSVLIRGMEMPERCGQCFLRVGNCKQRIYMEHRPKDCPLVEVKEPHGRLIDADKFKADYSMKNDCAECEKELRYSSRSCEYDRIYSKMDFCGWLDDAEVVIEAEGSEE